MSYLMWSDDDVLRLIQWVAAECAVALEAGDSSAAAALLRHTASFISLGDMAMGSNQRVNEWLDIRRSLILSDLPIGIDKTSRSDRDQIFESLRLLHEFWEKQPDTVSLAASENDVWLPESFDAKKC